MKNSENKWGIKSIISKFSTVANQRKLAIMIFVFVMTTLTFCTISHSSEQVNAVMAKTYAKQIYIIDDVIMEIEGVFEPIKLEYDVPLSDDIKAFVAVTCMDYGVEESLVYAIMHKESSYRPSIISETNDYGLMQINISNHKRLSNLLGIKDFLDPKDNALAGIYMLGELMQKYDDVNSVLMAYNGGEGYANKMLKNGTVSTTYSKMVLQKQEEIKSNAQ